MIPLRGLVAFPSIPLSFELVREESIAAANIANKNDSTVFLLAQKDIGVEKPDPRFFAFVEDHIPGFQKQTALVVGDSLSSDIAGGVSVGIDTCLLSDGPISATPTYQISTLEEFLPIILGRSTTEKE